MAVQNIDEERGIDLMKFSRLDCMVTVVDAYRFWKDFGSGDSLMDRKQEVSWPERLATVVCFQRKYAIIWLQQSYREV